MHISIHTFQFSVEHGTRVLLYNPLNGVMDIVDKQILDKIDSDLKNNAKTTSNETVDYLLKRGYMYESADDEESALKSGFERFKEKERNSNMRFVILPTYQCNSRCSYCFIGESIGQEHLMDDLTIDNAFAAMDILYKERGSGCLCQLSIFGGEPLIDTPAQRRVVEKILQNGDKRNFQIDIVSNGFDLASYVELLRKYGVAKVQVTFDGVREYHNQRRPAVDGRGESFDRIVAGTDAALCAGLAINVRMLLDRNSIYSMPQLVSFFKEKQWFGKKNFSVHLGSVFDCFRCMPAREQAKHLTIEEGNEALLKICNQDRSIADLLAIDWHGVRRFLYTGKFFEPTYKTCFGGTRMFAFDLKGGIYMCETTAGRPEYQVGTFSPELRLKTELMQAIDNRNAFSIPMCKECPQALLCAGGCAFNANVTQGSLLGPGCRFSKETIQYGLDYYWPEIKKAIESHEGSIKEVGHPSSDCCAAVPKI